METKLEELLFAFGQACSRMQVGEHMQNKPQFKALDAHITDMLTEATQRGVQAERERWKGRMNAVFGKCADGGEDAIPKLFPGTPKLTCNPFPTGHAVVNVKPEYVSLLGVLCEALDQAQHGKGAERHNLGGDAPFERQRMQTVSELVGSPDGMVYQAIKKLTEGMNLPTLDRQVKELLGAINYIAGIVLFLRKRGIEAACKPLEKWSKPCRWQAPDDKSAAEPMSDVARSIKVEIDAGTLHDLKQKARRYDEAVSGERPIIPQPQSVR